ncbi:hypothetical protein VaNZ11_011625 [Volvox africanus]|uniref:XPG-I domain-containing protein n=1 Tax=Volvox africanus TaxID=51714 RepID=A0ABQ5SDB6_9CHLO|nr:hypothetical protein VaNZ11_011625 [Volvox africanus]
MGIANLWTELAKYANVCRSWNGVARNTSVTGDARDDNTEIVAELCDKVLAIDTSVWLFQCSQQSDLKDAIFDEHARVLYIVIFRIMNLLRYGVTPLFVLEGVTPEAKMGRLNQRSLARGFSGRAVGNRRGGRHDTLGRKVVDLLDLMGIPHVDAPGEAEAMCAALTSVGLAHAAVTSDVDALLFGARRVYKECRVQMDNAKNNVLERVDAGEVAKRCFGLRSEGAACVQALQAVACLCGCDYSVAGGKGVGVKMALEAVQQLTVGREDDGQVIPELLKFLETGPDPRVTALSKCTGCKTCGHEKHGRQPCPICGPGPCRPKSESSPCECEFHRSEPQRKFMRVIARAANTGPSFSAECRATIAAFQSETERANWAAEELRRSVGSISWPRRPDVQGVFQLMHPLLGNTSSDPNKLLWTYPEVRDRMRPVLMEWDMRQGPEPSAVAMAHVEFRPRRIKQVAAKDGGLWAYLLEFDRVPANNSADAEFDRQQLANSKLVKGRHVRRTLVDRLWPHLLQLREEEEQAKLAKPKMGRSKAATEATASGSPGGTTRGAGPIGHMGSGLAASSSLGGATRSGISQGSREVMHRFLRMGSGCGVAASAAAPSTSVQQNGTKSGAVSSGGRSAVREAAVVDDKEKQYGDFGDGDDDMEYEVQMTQYNDSQGPVAETGGARRGGAADGRVVVVAGGARSQLAQVGGSIGGAAQVGMVALWDKEVEEDEEYGGGDNNYRSAEVLEREAIYDDLEDVIPTSLDELLASASQPTGRNRDVGRGLQPSSAPSWGGNYDNGPGAKRQGSERPAPVADAAGAAGPAVPSNEVPFRPQPTGPGPGQERGRGGRGGGYLAAAAVPMDHRNAQDQARGGGDRCHGTVLEVMDLTDSPALAAPVAGNRPGPASASATGWEAKVNAALGDSGENSKGQRTLALPRGLPHPTQAEQPQVGLGQSRDDCVGRVAARSMDGRQEGSQGEGHGKWMEEGQGSASKPKASQHCQQELEMENVGQQRQQQQGTAHVHADLQKAGPRKAERESPAARRARLMRTLFPDKLENGSASAVAPCPRARQTDHARPAGWLERAQSPQSEQDRRLTDVVLFSPSPSKRRNTGEGGVTNFGRVYGAVGNGCSTMTAIPDAAEPVDLTLGDSDDDDVVDLTQT